MSKTLPKGWCWATINDTGSYINGFAFKPSHRSDSGRPIIRIQNLTDPSKPFNYTELELPDDYKVSQNDILVSWSATLDVFLWHGPNALLNQHIFKVVPNESLVDKTFLRYSLKKSIEELLNTEHLHGSTMKHINRGPFLAHQIPLPPLNEQSRIADKIDELFSELDNGIEELETAQKKLELYRQSLLKSAVEGELSKEWRESQTEISETGEQLLARILKERRERWEQEKLKEFAEKGKNPPKNWQEKYPEPVQPDTNNLPQLPEGWVWAGNNQVALIQLGRQRSPSKLKGENPQKYIRAANITESGISLEDVLEMDFTEKEVQNYQLKTGDVLLTEASGSPQHVGRPAIWENFNDEIYCFQNTVIRFQGILILPEYAYFIFLAYQKLGKFSELSGGVGINHLSANKFSMVCIPLPSLDEQKFIIKELKLKLDMQEHQLNELKSLIQLNKAQKQNILKDAFTGVLVEQDNNDEPAQVLLERIQQQREAEALVKKATSKKRSAPKVKKEIGMSKNILDILKNQSDWISGQALATAFGLNGNSKIEEIEQFYEQLRTLSLDEKILVKPDQQNKKEQDLIKLKDKTDAS
ncbi:restriction endonuclease subunit S [Acinetobacter lwoffii]|uniref:restriction endonuclease subunit S n=1 Tax=Acinetobacter lwoffii TaxID=28090 RepID=UPI0032B4355A